MTAQAKRFELLVQLITNPQVCFVVNVEVLIVEFPCLFSGDSASVAEIMRIEINPSSCSPLLGRNIRSVFTASHDVCRSLQNRRSGIGSNRQRKLTETPDLPIQLLGSHIIKGVSSDLG